VPDNIAREGKMKEETAITINWVSDGVDCCCIGFLPYAYVVQGRLWGGILCQVVDVLKKNYPFKHQQAKWHHTKGYLHVSVITNVSFGAGALPQKKDKVVGAKGGVKKGN
jgi:hypothetical protein